MKITPEIKEQINILYLKLGTKATVAREIGCSASTVSKYIEKDFVLPQDRKESTFNGKIGNSEWLVDLLKAADDAAKSFCQICLLSSDEKEKINELRKEIYI